MNAPCTVDDVLVIIEGNACLLKMMLGKMHVPSMDQYYTLRSRYCKSKFLETRAGIPGDPFPGIPASIIEFWNTCDASLKALETDAALQFDAFNVAVTDPLHGFAFSIDATGSIAGIDHCIFLVSFSGSWRKKYAIKLVAQLDALKRSGNPTPVDSIVVLMLGKHDPVEKLYRVINRDDQMDKKGMVKNEGWDSLGKMFENGVKETISLFNDLAGKPFDSIPTNPAPINCGTCPFHNTIIANGMTCTGHYHPR